MSGMLHLPQPDLSSAIIPAHFHDPRALGPSQSTVPAGTRPDAYERAAFLAAVCLDDQELTREVDSLLTQAADSHAALDAPVWDALAAKMAEARAIADPSVRWLPNTIGRYRVLRLIGEGGMGTVYEAEQDHPRRIVALKVIRPGLMMSGMLRRFEREGQALGRLQHPGIAQIYEAGTSDSGVGAQPYFAMEFIHGKTLKEYAVAHQLPTAKQPSITQASGSCSSINRGGSQTGRRSGWGG